MCASKGSEPQSSSAVSRAGPLPPFPKVVVVMVSSSAIMVWLQPKIALSFGLLLKLGFL